MKQIKVLVVDDEVTICQTMKLYIERATKFAVITATSGKEAIRLARSQKPDIILLDIMMPGMSGSEVAEELRENPLTSNIPIIFITAAISKDEEVRKGGYIQEVPIIAKPVKAEEVVRRIEEILRQRGLMV